MKIEIFIGAAIFSVLFIDAIRYRRLYFKFKKIGVVDFKNILEYLEQTSPRSIPVVVESQEEAKRKITLITKVLETVGNWKEDNIKNLVKDLDFLNYHYNTEREALSDMLGVANDDGR